MGSLMYCPCTGHMMRKKRGGVQVVDSTATQTYRRVSYEGRPQLSHRVAFKLMEVPLPEYVDHINGDPLDNRWANLRKATLAENAWNKRKTYSSTGIKGVSRNGKKFIGRVSASGITHRKNFNTSDEAALWVAAKRRKLHGAYVHHG